MSNKQNKKPDFFSKIKNKTKGEVENLTTKNLFLKWKHCKVIECDDYEIDKYHWQRIALLEYNNKIYYVVINSGKINKVIPVDELPYEHYNFKVREENIDNKIDKIITELKKQVKEAEN